MSNHKCEGRWIRSPNGDDYDCYYNVPFSCEECYFTHRQLGDKRKGKKPWAKKYIKDGE